MKIEIQKSVQKIQTNVQVTHFILPIAPAQVMYQDRDSEIRSEDSDECPSDSFYTSDCSSSSYVSDDDSARDASNKRFSQPIAFRQQRELRSAVRQARNDRNQMKSSKLPNIARTMSAREFNSHKSYCSFTDS